MSDWKLVALALAQSLAECLAVVSGFAIVLGGFYALVMVATGAMSPLALIGIFLGWVIVGVGVCMLFEGEGPKRMPSPARRVNEDDSEDFWLDGRMSGPADLRFYPNGTWRADPEYDPEDPDAYFAKWRYGGNPPPA